MPIAPGTKFDRYEIIASLGVGGMGQVYLARDSRLERKVALKLLPEEFTKDPQRVLRFEQEAKAASALNHPNIITIHEIGDFTSVHFMAMEYIDGLTLRQMLQQQALSLPRALEIMTQITAALGAAHEAGIIHRDIKPENIMIRPDGIVKVLDFGLAKLTERSTPAVPSESPMRASLDTDPGTVMGTANYMSPEQVRGLKIDPRSDIFSLGIVLYEMVAGRAPFSGGTSADVMSAVLSLDPPPLTFLLPHAPLELQRIVSKALSKEREDRYQTVKDFMIDVRTLRRQLELTSTAAQTLPLRGDSGARNSISYETSYVSPSDPQMSAQTEIISGTRSAPTNSMLGQLRQNRRLLLFPLLLLFALLAVGGYITYRDREQFESIAVIPFIAVDAGKEAAVISDTLTDSLINDLSQFSHLIVKPRTSVERFKGKEIDFPQLARDLNVHAVLTGRVQQNGESLSVSIALVDAREDRNLWGQQYNRSVADLLLIEQEISRDVADKLHLKLSGNEQRYLEAYQLYLKGRNALNKRTAESLREGVRHFEEAIKIDPNFPPALAGLADGYNLLVSYSAVSGQEAFPKAKEAALKALALQDSLAEAHAALAFIHFQWEWDWLEAEREFRRAIDLKPNYAPAHQWYSSLLVVTGRNEEAYREALRAQELEPLSLIVSSHLAWITFLTRRYDQSIEEARKVLRLDPNFFPARRYVAISLEQQGKWTEAIAEYRRALAISRQSPLVKAELVHILAISGNRREAEELMRELETQAGQNHVSSYLMALANLGLGNRERALDLLHQAYQEHAERLIYVNTDPRFDALRREPRFQQLLQQVGFPE